MPHYTQKGASGYCAVIREDVSVTFTVATNISDEFRHVTSIRATNDEKVIISTNIKCHTGYPIPVRTHAMHARTQLNKQFHTVTLSSQLVPQYGLHFGILTLRAQPSKKRIFINWSHSQESQRLQYTQTGAGFECVYSYTARGVGFTVHI